MNKVKYELVGFIIVENLYGAKGFKNLIINTDEEGLNEIRKDPLQDYLSFGGIDVKYADFEVFKTEITENEEYRIEKAYKEPIERVAKGEYDLTDKEFDLLMEDEPVKITY